MGPVKWGLVGIGKLGQALLRQINNSQLAVGIYHPDQGKVDALLDKYPQCSQLSFSEIPNYDFIILALPAQQIRPFIIRLQDETTQLQNPVFINMATSVLTDTLKEQHPDIKWVGMKYMGHSEDLFLYGQGLFITEEDDVTPQTQVIHHFFSQLGKVVIDNERVLESVNKTATIHGILAAKQLQTELHAEGVPCEYIARAITSLAPQVMRSYAQGTLGHFAQLLAKEIDEKLESKYSFKK